ncbi:MAG: class I SAM-dependent methyltransferase [Pseudomonadota bacterium]|nr:class I SAM-dependent methyltransferase [Pseudomonadota bacterium]
MQALLDAIATMPLPGDACRIFHGRGGLYPGCEQWTLDAYPPVFVLTSFAPVTDEQLATIGDALLARWSRIAPPGQQGSLNWVFQLRGEALRASADVAGDGGEGAAPGVRPGPPGSARLMAGAVPDPHIVTEAGARYRVHVLRGQNHGLFLDMAEGRRWVREFAATFRARAAGTAGAAPASLAAMPTLGAADLQAKLASSAHPSGASSYSSDSDQEASAELGADASGARVLNLFAYTCAFSVAALQGGAAQVINVDMARGALATGQQNHQLNGLRHGATFWPHDIFNTWGKITRAGPYDLVIVDPPSYQKGSFVATKDYARLLRRLPDLLTGGGHALLCLNAPELPMAFLETQVREHAPALRFVARVPNPAVFADVDEGRGLKVGVYWVGRTLGLDGDCEYLNGSPS